MSNVNAPRGFKPVRYVDGRPYNGAVNSYKLPSGYATNLFVGDVVKLLTTGYLAKAVAGDQMRGVVVGFNWIQASGQPQVIRYWAASGVTLASQDVEVLVADDAGLVFEAVITNSTTVPPNGALGKTYNLIDNGGNTASGLSGEGIDYTTQATTAQQFRMVDFVRRVDNDLTSAYSRGLFAPALHDLRVNTGV